MTQVTTKAVDTGIQSLENLSQFLDNDISNLMSAVERLSHTQLDQNFVNFKEAIIPRKQKLEEISKNLMLLKNFLEIDLMPYIKEYIKTGELNKEAKK